SQHQSVYSDRYGNKNRIDRYPIRNRIKARHRVKNRFEQLVGQRPIPSRGIELDEFVQNTRQRCGPVIYQENSVALKKMSRVPKVQEPVDNENHNAEDNNFQTIPRLGHFINLWAELKQQSIPRKECSSVGRPFARKRASQPAPS